MIKIKKNIKQFLILLDIIQKVSIETNFEFYEDKIFIRFASPSGFSLGILTLNKTFFDEYEIEKNEIICIDTSSIYKIIKKIGKKEIDIELNHNGSLIKFTSGKSNFTMKTYSVPKDERPVPTPEFDTIWNIQTTEFLNLISEHLEFDEVAIFNSSDEGLKTITDNNLISGEVFTEAENIKQGNATCAYDLKILSIILKINEISKTIKFSYGKDMPCNIHVNEEELIFDWYLAPRVEPV